MKYNVKSKLHKILTKDPEKPFKENIRTPLTTKVHLKWLDKMLT